MAKSVLVIGAGRFGKYTIMKLHELGHHVLVVDKSEERLERVLPYTVSARIGDSTSEEFMKTLGIRNFDLCIVAIGDNFLSSLETTFLLSELGAQKIVSRATSGSQEKFLLRNGADEVVFPERQFGSWTAIRYSSDYISNYIELVDDYAVFEITVPQRWDSKRIGELQVRKNYNLNILGVKNETMDMSITDKTVLKQGQVMLVLGKNSDVQKLFTGR
ncbi:MAG: TrkA family potassium uptake protein [Solobacterium sp.]|nr:TrkA family potassium uptake protein [Solobacterium sp.]